MNYGKLMKIVSVFGLLMSTATFLLLVWRGQSVTGQEAWWQGFNAGLFCGFMFMWIAMFFIGELSQDLEKDNL